MSSRGTVRLRGEIEARIRTLGIERNVVLTGFHPHPEQLIALADVCLLASAREGLPRVLMQYLAGGRPVVAADLPCIDDVLRDGVNGLVIGSDLDGLADAVITLLDDPARRAGLARGAAATELSEWDAERMGERLEAVYADVIRERSASAHGRGDGRRSRRERAAGGCRPEPDAPDSDGDGAHPRAALRVPDRSRNARVAAHRGAARRPRSCRAVAPAPVSHVACRVRHASAGRGTPCGKRCRCSS